MFRILITVLFCFISLTFLAQPARGDLQSVILKSIEPVYIIDAISGEVPFDMDDVVDDDLEAVFNTYTPETITLVFSDYEDVLGSYDGVDLDNCLLIKIDTTLLHRFINQLRAVPSTQLVEDNKYFDSDNLVVTEETGGDCYDWWDPLNVSEAHAIVEGCAEIQSTRLSLVDSGVDVSGVFNPIISGDDKDGNDTIGYNYHGTKVYSIIASYGQQLRNALFEASCMSFSCKSWPDSERTLVHWVEAFKRAIDFSTDTSGIIITSQPTNTPNEFSYFAWNILKIANEKGIAVVAAAGNADSPDDYIVYPARYDGEVISVGAVDNEMMPMPLYDYGPAMDLSAPGQNIELYSLDPNSYGSQCKDGTSYASPIVAAAINQLKRIKSDLRPEDCEALLRATCTDLHTPGFDHYTGYGLISFDEPCKLLTDPDYQYITGTSTGSELVETINNQTGMFIGYDGITDGEYDYTRYKYDSEITYNVDGFVEATMAAWGRAPGTNGIRIEEKHTRNGDPYYPYILHGNMGYVEDGTLSDNGFTVSTYAYDVVTDSGTIRIGPSSESAVTVGYGAVIHTPPVTIYAEMSSQTGMQYDGTPYSCVTLDYDNDSLMDLFITIQDGQSVLFRNIVSSPGSALLMQDVTTIVFSDILELYDLYGTSTVDYNNDGLEDIFVTSSNNAALFKNVFNIETGLHEFQNVTEAVGLAGFIDNSFSGTWADIDRDNDLDLFVTRAIYTPSTDGPTPETLQPLTDVLFRNDVNETGEFTNISDLAEGMLETSTKTVTSSWADLDNDQDMDLVVPAMCASGSPSPVRLYLNNGDGSFVEDAAGVFDNLDICSVSGATWFDADNDQDLDLVFSSQVSPTTVQNYFLNDSGLLNKADLNLQGSFTGVFALDHDLDGDQDLLFLPARGTDTPHLLSKTGVIFEDLTDRIGLNTMGKVQGAAISDFNAGGGSAETDGDIDIYFGRPDDQEFFFRASKYDEADPPLNNYLAFELAGSGANNSSSVGVQLTISYGGLSQTQIISAGNSRGGQADRIITFGLGDYDGSVDLNIVWPGGYSQDSTISSVELNPVKPIVIYDDTIPDAILGSLSHSVTLLPSDKLEWTIQWDTLVSSKWDLDTVVVDIPGVGSVSFTPLSENVSASVLYLGDRYQHGMTFETECATGFYGFTGCSSTETEVGSSVSANARNAFCPSGGQFP